MQTSQLFEEAADYYRKQRSGESPLDQNTTVAFLREIQEIFGYIPAYTLETVAQVTGYKLPLLQKLLKLYPSLKTSGAVHEIVVCSGGRCGSANGPLLEQLKKGLEALGPDRAVLRTQMCFKQCGKGPNIQLDGQLIHGCTPQTVQEILEKVAK